MMVTIVESVRNSDAEVECSSNSWQTSLVCTRIATLDAEVECSSNSWQTSLVCTRIATLKYFIRRKCIPGWTIYFQTEYFSLAIFYLLLTFIVYIPITVYCKISYGHCQQYFPGNVFPLCYIFVFFQNALYPYILTWWYSIHGWWCDCLKTARGYIEHPTVVFLDFGNKFG